MKLVIVESPAKATTIEKYLGKEYSVVSSVGHIRDLAIKGKGGLGVDVDNNFEPNYTVVKGKGKLVKELKAAAKKADHVLLATDPDREGEAISWHLFDALGLDNETTDRVVFHEITKPAVLKAIEHPRKINYDLVESQETRRILDRIIGFKLSSLLQNKIKSKSAGRVQSVALKLIVELEERIQSFVPEEYWEIKANIPPLADLVKFKTKKIKLTCKEEVDLVLSKLDEEFIVSDIQKKQSEKKAKAPFITSTLQQEASTRLGYGSRKTMMTAQKLYEGVELNGEQVGLITYMRTDSTRLSNEFILEAKGYITDEFGKQYFKGHTSKVSETSQDAHEAIRPTSLDRHPDRIKTHLKSDEYRLYKLIYERAVASLMSSAKFNDTKVLFNNSGYQFELNGKVQIDPGYLHVYSYDEVKDKLLPEFELNSKFKAEEVLTEQKFTKPPARFSEAGLIKKMEELGIGRPSTYAQTLDTIVKRHYVTLESKRFTPTDKGKETSVHLDQFFNEIINVDYTKNMELTLDGIAEGQTIGSSVLKEFYDKFIPMVDHAYENMEKKEPEKTGESCPECGSDLVIRIGRYGEFVACSNYPECKYIKKEKKEVVSTGVTCPVCKEGTMVERVAGRGKNKGNKFYACDRFPKCKNAVSDKPTGDLCETCGSLMVQGKEKPYCSSKTCDTNKKEG